MSNLLLKTVRLVLFLHCLLIQVTSNFAGWTDIAPRQGWRKRVDLRGGGEVSSNRHMILQETVIHNRWRKLVSRTVQLPSQSTADFEIVSQGDRGGTVSDEAVLIFAWNTTTQTAVLIREYMPSVHKFMNGLAAGMVEDKHSNDTAQEKDNHASAIETAARHELEEECRLTGGTWYRLCDPTTMDKYTTTRLSVYLVLDPEQVDEDTAKPRDETEEGMSVVQGVDASQLLEWIRQGEMTVVGGWAAQLALNKLRELGEML